MSFSSSVSSDSSKERRLNANQWMNYKYSSKWEYIVITLGCTFTVRNFYSFKVLSASSNEPTIIHHIICFAFVGLPLNYMQILIGQYSQLGVIFFKHLSPIGYGVGYTMILNSLLSCSQFGTTVADFLMYFLACIDTKLEWMSCPSNTEYRCWDSNSTCEKECITNKTWSSAYVYWKETFMHNIDFKPKHLTLGKPIWARVVPMCLMWAVVFGIVSMGMEKYKKIVRINFYVASISVATVLLVCLAVNGGTAGVALMFRINTDSFSSAAAWSYATSTVIQDLALGRACHMTFGSYMTPDMPSDILTIFCVLLNFLGILSMSMVIHASMGITMAEAHISQSHFMYIFGKGAPTLTTIPEGLGFMGGPQVWTMLYILACICLLVNNLTIQIDIINRSIANAHYASRAYRRYILVALCSCSCFIGFLFNSKEGYVILTHLHEAVLEQVRGISMFLMAVLTFWIYRVQRISDDIHFLQGAQPTKFWKIFWYIMPCAIGFTYFYLICLDETRKVPDVFLVMHYTVCLIIMFPIPLCMFLQIFRYMRMHNLVGILQPEERWGPPDPKERHLRHLFNPRQEIRSRRRNDTCNHNCLLGSKYLKKVIAEERELRKTLLLRRSAPQKPDKNC